MVPVPVIVACGPFSKGETGDRKTFMHSTGMTIGPEPGPGRYIVGVCLGAYMYSQN